MEATERTDALAQFSPEEVKIFWGDIGRAGRYVALCISLLEAVIDELATLPDSARSEDGASCAATLSGDALGYAHSAQEILTTLADAWR